MIALTRDVGLDAGARGSLGPGFWPRLALIGLALACCQARRRVAPGEGSRRFHPVAAVLAVKLVAADRAVVAYVLLAPLIGFALATPLHRRLHGALRHAIVAALAANVVIGTAALCTCSSSSVPAVAEGRRAVRDPSRWRLPGARDLLRHDARDRRESRRRLRQRAGAAQLRDDPLGLTIGIVAGAFARDTMLNAIVLVLPHVPDGIVPALLLMIGVYCGGASSAARSPASCSHPGDP